jgi:hypothetical protein
MIVKVKKTFSIFLSCILIFSLFYLPSSFQIEVVAQGGLLTHQDTVNGFTVSYPASWNKQDNVYGTHGVQLSPNLATRDNVLIDVVQQPGATLDSWTQEKIGSINARSGTSILQLNPATLGGNPAYKVEYLWEGDKILEIWAVIGHKLYAISYVAEGEDRYQQNLSAFQSIVDSFRLTTAGSPPVTSLTTTTAADAAKPSDNNNENGEPKTANCGGEPCTPTEKEDSTLDDELTANCGGEPCTPTEKEDSTLDDETEEEDDGENGENEGEEEDSGDGEEDSGGDEGSGEDEDSGNN